MDNEQTLRNINFELGNENNSFTFEMSNKTVGRGKELHMVANAIRAAADRRNNSNQSTPPTIVSDGSHSYFVKVIDEYGEPQDRQEPQSDEEAAQEAEERNATVIALHGDDGVGKLTDSMVFKTGVYYHDLQMRFNITFLTMLLFKVKASSRYAVKSTPGAMAMLL